jgi:hypothetical protein
VAKIPWTMTCPVASWWLQTQDADSGMASARLCEGRR